MRRRLIRGVTAGFVGSAAVAAGLTVGPSLANAGDGSAPTNPTLVRPMPVAAQQAVMRWKLPNVRYLRHVHRRRHHHHHHQTSTQAQPVSYSGSPQQIGATLAARLYGWTGAQWSCLDALWSRESGWNVYARNPSSGAYGIPQALPASKMAAYGSDWQTNPVTQIRWGLAYIAGTYGTPCGALGHSSSTGYY